MPRDSIGTVNMKMVFNADEWVEGLRKADRELSRTLKKMETETDRTAEQLRRAMMQSTGAFGQSASQAALSERHAAIMDRDRWQKVRGIGQEMVAPGAMSRGAYGRGDGILVQWDHLAKAVLTVNTAIQAVRAVTAAWRGDLKSVQQALEKMPSIIGESARAGREIGDSFADWWTSKIYQKNVRGLGPAALRLKLDAAKIDAEMAEVAAQQTIRKMDRETKILSAALEDQAMLRLHMNAEDEMLAARTEAAKQAILRRYLVERDNLLKAQAAAESHAEDQRRQERKRKADEDVRQVIENFRIEERRRHDLQRQLIEYDRVLSNIEETRLRMAGKRREAEMVSVRREYDERIKLATAAGRSALSIKLAELRELKIAELSASRATYDQVAKAYANVGGGVRNDTEKLIGLQRQTVNLLTKIESHTKNPVALAG